MKENLDTEVYFTPREAARHLNLSLSAIKNYIYADKLRTLKTPGGHHRISKSELLAAMGEQGIVSHQSAGKAVISIEPYCAMLVNVFKMLGAAGDSFIAHSNRVADICYKLSKALCFTDEDINYARLAGLVHDIGHMAVDRRILLKSEPLTAKEYESLKLHPLKGKELLSSIKDMKEIAEIVSQHHERVDGAGYPKGLSEKGIKKTARIISIAEAYDAMVSDYSYKKPVSKDIAISELIANKNLQFDAEIVEIFIQLI